MKPKTRRAARRLGRFLLAMLLALAGFLALWYGAFIVAFSPGQHKPGGLALVLGSIALFTGAIVLLFGRLPRRLPPGD